MQAVHSHNLHSRFHLQKEFLPIHHFEFIPVILTETRLRPLFDLVMNTVRFGRSYGYDTQ